MRVQVLVATMHQKDYSMLDKMNIQSDAVVINQCNEDNIHSFNYRSYYILWINSTERGLSRSRNMALKNANADICVICDDDERLSDGYPYMINNAYTDIPEADFIAFNINRNGWNEKEELFIHPRKIGRYKTYSSVHITFKREKVYECGIEFDVRFGAGSSMYACAEDAIFCMVCHKKRFNMYTYPGILCEVDCSKSTWFSGYNGKYFYDVGAYLSAAYPRSKDIFKWYYPLRFRKLTDLSPFEIISAIKNGFYGYKKQLNYDQYRNLRSSCQANNQ